MPELLHSDAPSPAPIRAVGARRINLDMCVRLDQADRFKGFAARHREAVRAIGRVRGRREPYLGLPPHFYKLIGWLVRKTLPQDWEEGSRSVAWRSARHQAEFLGLLPSRVTRSIARCGKPPSSSYATTRKAGGTAAATSEAGSSKPTAWRQHDFSTHSFSRSRDVYVIVIDTYGL